MKPKLVFTDVDGTLLLPDGTLSDRTKQVVRRLHEEKIPFILVSARSPQEMFALYRELELVSPVVGYNGGIIYKMGRDGSLDILVEYVLEREELVRMYDVIKEEFPELNINLYSGTNWFAERQDQWLQMEIDLVKITPEYRELDELIESNIPIHKIMLIGEIETILKAENTLKSLDRITSSIHRSNPNYLEITNQQATKLNGLKTVLKHFFPDIKPEEVMALGDGPNDWDMLSYVGFGVVMGNAPEEMKVSAKYVTGTNAEDGFAQAVEKFILEE